MSAKGFFLILKRFRAGDEDLMLKVYGPYGVGKLFVPEGYRVERGFLGHLEPFNLVKLTYRQLGDIGVLEDLIWKEPLSYLCVEDYRRYLWMSSLIAFVEKWFLQYDGELLRLVVSYLRLDPSNPSVFLLKFKLEFLKYLGLYREDIFEEGLRGLVKRLLQEQKVGTLQRLRISPELLSRLEQKIEAHLSSCL